MQKKKKGNQTKGKMLLSASVLLCFLLVFLPRRTLWLSCDSRSGLSAPQQSLDFAYNVHFSPRLSLTQPALPYSSSFESMRARVNNIGQAFSATRTELISILVTASCLAITCTKRWSMRKKVNWAQSMTCPLRMIHRGVINAFDNQKVL